MYFNCYCKKCLLLFTRQRIVAWFSNLLNSQMIITCSPLIAWLNDGRQCSLLRAFSFPENYVFLIVFLVGASRCALA